VGRRGRGPCVGEGKKFGLCVRGGVNFLASHAGVLKEWCLNSGVTE
jgi:hypothetical protein